MTDRFRQTTLTVLGAVGYIAFIIAVAGKSLGYPVSWEGVALLLLTSSALLGVDFGLDIIPSFVDRREKTQLRDQGENDKK